MPSVLPLEIIALIIDIAGENKDINLLKELALVSHSCLQICNKHLFATVELSDANSRRASSKDGFVELFKSRPDIVKYIRKLTYMVGYDEDHLLSPILPNFLRTISRLNRLTISGFRSNWNTLDSSLTSAFLHLMHLPTINHIDLSNIRDFPISSLTLSVNLHRLDIFRLSCSSPHSSPEIVVQSEMPQIHEFHASESSLQTSRLLHAKSQDGRPAFNFMDLRRLSMSLTYLDEDERNIRYLLQNATLLEKLHLSVGHDQSLAGLHDILSLNASTLKVLDMKVFLYHDFVPLVLAGLCEELEAMAGYNTLDTLSFEVGVDGDETDDIIGRAFEKLEKVLIKPGWSALRHVSFKVSIACCKVSSEESAELFEELQTLPDKYLSHLPNHESVAFNYSVYIAECYSVVNYEF